MELMGKMPDLLASRPRRWINIALLGLVKPLMEVVAQYAWNLKLQGNLSASFRAHMLSIRVAARPGCPMLTRAQLAAFRSREAESDADRGHAGDLQQRSWRQQKETQPQCSPTYLC